MLALFIIELQRLAFHSITGVGILAPGKDTARTKRMRKIANEALEMEI
jgi:hypothetical protein